MESKSFANNPETDGSEESETVEATVISEEEETEKPRESEFIRDTRRAAENAKHLGYNSETFQSLGLRDRTVLTFLDIGEDIPEEEQSNDPFVFMDRGVKYGDMLLPYTEPIQREIHDAYLKQCLRSPEFGKKLLAENQAWQEHIIESDKKELTAKATSVFQSIMHSQFANPAELAKIRGLEESEFLELLQLEDSLSDKKTSEDFFEATGIQLSSDQNLNWHIENAEYFDAAYGSEISNNEYSQAFEIAKQQHAKLRAIKRVYDAFIDKVTKPSYRPLQKVRVNPYKLSINYYSDRDDNILRGKRKLNIDLSKRYDAPKTTLPEAIDSILLFCEQNDLQPNLGDIDLESKQKITQKQVEDFIENNAQILNNYCNAHLREYNAARKEIDKSTAPIKIRNSFSNDDSFREEIEKIPTFEQNLRTIFHEARNLEIIRIIYGNTSEEYQEKLSKGSSTNAEYNAIQAEFNAVMKTAQESGVPLKGETTRLEDAESTLRQNFGIFKSISKSSIEIIQAHHKDFLQILSEGIAEQKVFRNFQKKYFAQKEAEKTLEKRISGAYENQADASDTKSEYYKKLEQLSEYHSCISKVKQSVRRELFAQQTGSKEKLDVLRYALELPAKTDTNAKTLNELISEFEAVAQKYNISSDPKQYVQDFIEDEKRSSELKIKLASGCITSTKREHISQKKRNRTFAEAEEEYDLHLFPAEAAKKWAQHYTSRKLLDEKIATIAQELGYEDRAKNILFMPGYMICFNKNDFSSILPINASQFEDSENPEVQLIASLADKPPFRSDGEIPVARSVLNRKLETEMLKNESVGSSQTERRMFEMEEKYNIHFPRIGIEATTGRLESQPTKAELNSLETIYPFFGKFIARVEKSISYTRSPDELASSMQKIQREFICNEGQKGASLIFQHNANGRGAKLDVLADLLRTKSIPSSKALELIAYDAAICDYSTLKPDETKEFVELAKDKLPLDARTFMVLYQKAITNPLELRASAIKLGYCREFAKYCAGGASTPELKAFFDERAQKAKQGIKIGE